MSLLDGIDVLEDRLEQHVEELSRKLVYEFAKNHCRYNAFRSYDDGTFWVYNNVYDYDYIEPHYRPSTMHECTQVELYDDYIYPIDVNYPILIEDYDKPELPSYIKFAFPVQDGYECRYDRMSDSFATYHSPIYKGSIVMLNCHSDLLKGSDLEQLGINIIRLNDVTIR